MPVPPGVKAALRAKPNLLYLSIELRLPTLQQCTFMVPVHNTTHQTISLPADGATVLILKEAICKLVGQPDVEWLGNLFLRDDRDNEKVGFSNDLTSHLLNGKQCACPIDRGRG